ncbi:hypothetical protein NQ314_012362 [Rhamnusium bicolor]|uniref:Fibronectin type-III domain-containing protein n=1 Tax=Rhamnusium bicolor TaxID=1586634 RepID=A0AAV8XEM8_9CUCU|nr:hypothetical protein NQ314_012362 [Rhamnusium bicolor]
MTFHEKYTMSIIVLLLFGCILGKNTCGNLVTKGYTVPHGDIVLQYGDPLDITCNLHSKIVDEYGKNASSKLYFTRNNVPFPLETVETINSTSIKLHIEKHPKAKNDNYYCMFKAAEEEEIICLNVVIVGVNRYVFEHFKHVLPNPPENLTAVATSPHSIRLSWVIPSSMVNFATGLHHRILFQCEYYDKVVSMRSALADDDDESMWSDNATVTARTKSKVPDCPPKTNIGSFEIVNNGQNRDAYVYWQQLKEEQKNGQNFSYYVKVENHPEIRPVELTKAYARFQDLSTSDDYKVNIWSVNVEGRSVEKSTVIIPATRIREPLNFIKVAHKEDLYELSWEPPRHLDGVEDPEITNYTIFWCSNERDRPYPCDGFLNWTMVPNDTVKYNQTLTGNNIYQIAISANTRKNSSGMSWAECTVVPDRIVGKIKNVWINSVGSDFIDVGWKLDCLSRIGPIRGFIIFYCPIESPVQTNCKKTSERNITIMGDKQPFKLTGLKPYTTYRLTVGFIINHSTYSQTSEPLFNTTNEAAPNTSPLNVEVYNVTNSSISLKWQPPKEINGILKCYHIYYNNKNIIIDPDKNEETLKNLTSFENYSITMDACTVACSDRSKPINVMTNMWAPGVIKQPSITSQNDTHLTLSWDKPVPPRGEVNYYQLQFNLENKTMMTYKNVTTQNYSIEGCSSGKYKALYVSVRAVNIVNGEHEAGPWSYSLFYSCSQHTLLVYILVVGSVVIIAVGMSCIFKRLYIYCKVMRDVEVKLPPGLAPVIERDLVPWSSEKHVEDIDRSSRADEELLLQQISETRLSGESSGCSSAHESITLSLESTNHISPSDSGTEHPRSPSLNEESRRNSLRQRNVSATRPSINKGYVVPDAISTTHWAPKPSPTPAGNYCVLGVDPTNQTETESPYVPISNTNTSLQMPYTCDLSQPPPYVMTGDFIKTSNPGYVPYSATEPADKNTGYVVAGLTKDLLSPDLLQCDTPKPMSTEEKPIYVKAAEPVPNLKGVQFPWQQPPLETNLPKSGYVTVGDAPAPKTISDVTKGYVPHRQFEAKSLKED